MLYEAAMTKEIKTKFSTGYGITSITVNEFYEYFKKRQPFSGFERWMIAAIYAGGLGNMIDRLRLGYVVDMIETQFMDFPVFNVADCFITCGCIALFASLAFCNKAIWKDEKKK